jgi:D-alanyl-D-alanine carboxypeptidase/D-alanyl-D-alanine-endopeptidase (penicillin-binding protein 4)
VDDPALWAAQLFKEALEGQGILISGRVAVRHRYAGLPPPVRPQLELASRISAPLVQLAQIVNKVSQNLHAELLLREVARVRGREPSREDALKQLAEFLAEAGVARSTYTFEDGSGLSRLNLVSPATTTALLVHMYRSPWRESWLRLLPISGQDGTLRTRFAGKPNAPLVRAKTGSLSHIAALAGYTGPEDQPKRAFSIMVNNFRVPEAQIYKLVDAIALAIAE